MLHLQYLVCYFSRLCRASRSILVLGSKDDNTCCRITFGIIIIAVVSVLIYIYTSGTTVSTYVTRPAELDMNGANSIAILPFREHAVDSKILNTLDVLSWIFTDERPGDRARAAKYLTTELQLALSSSEYLRLVNADAVTSALKSGRKSPVDAYITGYLLSFDSDLRTTIMNATINGREEPTIHYQRYASATVVYEIVDASTDHIIHSRSVDVSDSSYWETSISYLPPASRLLESDFNSLVRKITRQVQPYAEKVSVKLIRSNIKSPLLDRAKEYAKNGQLDQSYELYQEFYEDTHDFAAGYNAALLRQIRGDLEGARKRLRHLIATSRDSRVNKARSALEKLNYEIHSAEVLKKQRQKAEQKQHEL